LLRLSGREHSEDDVTQLPVHADVGNLSLPALLVHGGAGTFDRIHEDGDIEWLNEGLRHALLAGWEVLTGGGNSLEAVVEAVAALEDGGRFNAGRGAVTTSDGTYEFDASVMDGRTGRVGAICAATWPANPVRVANAVAEAGGTPDGPLLLAGLGADRFAEDRGFRQMTQEMLAGARAGSGAKGLAGEDQRGPGGGHQPPGSTAGTVGAVAVDAAGGVAAATSTGGRSGQLRGRVGDAPIPGAGTWASANNLAVSATGAGEAFIVAGFGHLVEWRVQAGDSLESAVSHALDAVAALGGDGGGIAISPDGSFVAGFNSRAMARGWRDGSTEVAALFPTT
jgi:L-asparaginase / beta-aspartyl-peptidase